MNTPSLMKQKVFALTAATLTAAVLTVIAQTAFAEHNTPQALEARVAPVGEINVVATDGKTASGNKRGKQSGKAVYQATCAVCHAAGIAGAPKTGDRPAWRARLAQGTAVLNEHAINGFQGATGVMLPRGGNTALSDEEVKAAVVYMVERSK